VKENVGGRKRDWEWACGKGGEQRRWTTARLCVSYVIWRQTRSSCAHCEVAFSGICRGETAEKECIVCMIGRITGTARSGVWVERNFTAHKERATPLSTAFGWVRVRARARPNPTTVTGRKNSRFESIVLPMSLI
jgi:hypothetical protein